MNGEDAQRRGTDFFRVVDDTSELSKNPAVTDVPDDLGLVERIEEVIWDLNELVAPSSGN